MLAYRFLIKKFLLLLIIVVLSDICLAQKLSKIDSLIKVLNTQKEDSSKVKTLNDLSRHLWQKASYPEAKNHAEEALTLAEKIKFNTGKADAYHNIAIIYVYQSNYGEAFKNHFAGLKVSEGIGYKKGMADSYNGIAGVYWNQGNYPEALKNLFASLKLEEEVGNKRGVANLFNNIGLIYSIQGNYPEALKNHFASLKTKEGIEDKKGISNSLHNIGLIYSGQGKYAEALKYFFASLKIKEETGDKAGVANAYNSIGLIYWNQNNYSEALKNCFISLKLNEQIGSKKGIALAYNSIGLINDKERNHSDALKNHLASLKIREEIGDKKGIACSFVNIGETYVNLKNFSEAKRFLTDALSLSKKIGSKEDIIKSYSVLARLDSATGSFEQAYYNHKLYTLYRDSTINEDNSKKMVQTQMQYEFTKKEDSLKYQQSLTDKELQRQTLLMQQHQQTFLIKEKEFTLITNERQIQQLKIEKDQADFAAQKIFQKAEADNKQGQLVLLNKEKAIQGLELNKQKQLQKYLIAGLALFAILSFFIYRNYRIRQNLKLQTLRNKIASDLHDDVGSTLSSISIFAQMAQQQSKEVIPFLETIEDSSRKMLDAMADIVWTINPENDQFEKIILRMRSFAYELLGAKKIDFEFIADEEVVKMNIPMNIRKNLYLIFKEATNNMVKYSGADKVLFTVKGEKNNLTLLIHDNGKGFDTHQITEGNGLKNMKRRAEEMGGHFMIDSHPGKGTIIQLKVAV